MRALLVFVFVGLATVPSRAQAPDAATIHEVADRAPSMVGGLSGLAHRVRYPAEAAADSVEGRVYVQFVVATDGTVSEPSCPRSPDERLCAAAIAAITSAQFEPGEIGGQPVAVRTVLPVDFRLPDPEAQPRPIPQLRPIPAGRTLGSAADSVHNVVETAPELIGGLVVLQRRVQYPEMARRAGIEGTVFVQFVVDEVGEVSHAVCARSPDAMLCDAALAAVETSRFRPGTQEGRPVKVRYTLPVAFRLR